WRRSRRTRRLRRGCRSPDRQASAWPRPGSIGRSPTATTPARLVVLLLLLLLLVVVALALVVVVALALVVVVALGLPLLGVDLAERRHGLVDRGRRVAQRAVGVLERLGAILALRISVRRDEREQHLVDGLERGLDLRAGGGAARHHEVAG